MNYEENHTMPDPQAVHAAFAARPRGGHYNLLWDSWLLPRVDGQFTGTTDEIIQWAACKWGLPDNLLRAEAAHESSWFEALHFTDGQCYWRRGCGDDFPGPTSDTKTYCDGLAAFGHDYQTDTNSTVGASPYPPQSGMCPETFSIVGIKAWEDPAWTAPAPPYPGNQNGTMPFSRDSTAFAMDYIGSFLRGCYEGWIKWLNATGGDIWGCVGSWYSGEWHSPESDAYATGVRKEIANHTWLTAAFDDARRQYECDPVKGCPV
jgi:hypothetical protein